MPASAIWAGAYVSVGAFAGGTYRELLSKLHSAGYLFVGAIIVFVAVAFAVKKLVVRREARYLQAPYRDGDAL